MTNSSHECVECRQVVALGDAYFFNFTTGAYRHRACGLDTGRSLEELVSPAPRAQHTPPGIYEEIERLRVVNTVLLAALKDLLAQGAGLPKSCGHAFFCACPELAARDVVAKATGG